MSIPKFTRFWAKERTNELLQNYYLSLDQEGCCYTLGQIISDSAALLADGSQVRVILGGKASAGTICPMVKIKKGLYYAHLEEKKQYGPTVSNKNRGYILELVNSEVVCRKLGSSVRYGVDPSVYTQVKAKVSTFGINPNPGGTPPRVTAEIKATTGGFSASGNHVFVGGFIVDERQSVRQPNGLTDPISGSTENHKYFTGQNILVWYAVYRNFKLTQDQENRFYITSERPLDINVINVTSKYLDFVKPNITAPLAGQNGENEVMGLAGANRAKAIFRSYYDVFTANDITLEDILEFVQILADFLEITFEEALQLLPPSALASGFTSQLYGRFYPVTHIEYHALTPQLTTQYGPPNEILPYSGTTSAEDDGFLNSTWSVREDHINPSLKEAGFVFTNDLDDEPVMDIVVTLIDNIIYCKTGHSFETVFNIHETFDCYWPGGNWIQGDFIYKRGMTDTTIEYELGDNIFFDPYYGFTDDAGFFPTLNLTFVQYPEGTIQAGGYTGEPFPPVGPTGIPWANYGYWTENGQLSYYGKNFSMYSGGTEYYCNSSSTYPCDFGEFGSNRLYSVRFFSEYGGEVFLDGEYCPWNPGCPYTEKEGICDGPSFWALRSYLQTGSVLDVDLALPNSGNYDFTTFDGRTVPYFTIVPNAPTAYGLWQTAYQISFGCYPVNEDIDNPNWPGPFPFADFYEFGRTVMCINDVHTDAPTVRFINRPQPTVHDYDHLWRAYRGPDGGRALLIQDDYFKVWAWNRNYVDTDTGNQELYLESPVLINDVFVIPAGGFPYPAIAAKYYDKENIVYYNIEATGETTSKEVLRTVNTPLNGNPITFGETHSGPLNVSDGILLDYIIRN